MHSHPARIAPAPQGGYALVTAMNFYVEDRRPPPAPSKARRGEELVSVPASVEAKVLLLNEPTRGVSR